MSNNNNVITLSSLPEVNDMLTETIRQGAQTLLSTAIELEVKQFIEKYAHVKDDEGRRLVVKNGFLPERTVQTGIGQVPVKMPRVRNNSDQEIQFHSSLLPPYLKRAKSIEELVPWLYLKGISTNDMGTALKGLLGENAKGLSVKNIGHLTQAWQEEHAQWMEKDLSSLRIVYAWADGVYLKARMDDKQCLLTIIGADESGKKHVLALYPGERESTLSWKEVLLDLKRRGLQDGFELAIGDGALGFWGALSALFPETKQQRCWVHKTRNVLNNLPKSQQLSAKKHVQDIWMANTREDAQQAFDDFITLYNDKYHKAVECLKKDRETLLSFYDFPAQHWHHIRTTNPIESMFATVKLRTAKTRGCLSRKTGMAMVYKLAMAAEGRWPRIRGSKYAGEVIRGIKFKDGNRVDQQEKRVFPNNCVNSCS